MFWGSGWPAVDSDVAKGRRCAPRLLTCSPNPPGLEVFGQVFLSFSAEVDPRDPQDRKSPPRTSTSTENQPRRPFLSPFRGTQQMSPGCLQAPSGATQDTKTPHLLKCSLNPPGYLKIVWRIVFYMPNLGTLCPSHVLQNTKLVLLGSVTCAWVPYVRHVVFLHAQLGYPMFSRDIPGKTWTSYSCRQEGVLREHTGW